MAALGCSDPAVRSGTQAKTDVASATDGDCCGCVAGFDASRPVDQCGVGWFLTRVDGVKRCVPDVPIWGLGQEPVVGLTDMGDGTVVHTLTGLMWQKDSGMGGPRTWDGANDYCQQLVLAGHADWRMPTVAEMASILHFEDPSSHLPAPFHTDGAPTWTLSEDPGSSGRAFRFFFYDFDIDLLDLGPKEDLGWARCVRGQSTAKASSTPRFTVAQGGVVHDAMTGLQWQQCPEVVKFSQFQTDYYCAHDSPLPGNGWRVPSARELASLSLRSWRPAIDTQFFRLGATAEQDMVFWTSTYVGGDPVFAWALRFTDGTIFGHATYKPEVTGTLRVMCVR